MSLSGAIPAKAPGSISAIRLYKLVVKLNLKWKSKKLLKKVSSKLPLSNLTPQSVLFKMMFYSAFLIVGLLAGVSSTSPTNINKRVSEPRTSSITYEIVSDMK
jgi:hypothetical protein